MFGQIPLFIMVWKVYDVCVEIYMHVLHDKMNIFQPHPENCVSMWPHILCYVIAVAIIAPVLGPGSIQSAALLLNSSKTQEC